MVFRYQIEKLLRAKIDRGDLLQSFESLAYRRGFRELAYLWAVALYERDPRFFESFLIRHLPRKHAVVSQLLPRIEADGHESLFKALYGASVSEEQWNRDLLALAQSEVDDDELLRAVEWRDIRDKWYQLSEECALALYLRHPTALREFLRRHLHRSWKRPSYAPLRRAVWQQGDEAFYWHLFGEFASKVEWRANLKSLLQQDLPVEQVEEALEKRLLNDQSRMDREVLLDFLQKYGVPLVPFIEEHIAFFQGSARLLAVLKQLDDQSHYWRLFFKISGPDQWHKALDELLKRPLTVDELSIELEHYTPPEKWSLTDEIALALYRRDSSRFRPFLERFTRDGSLELLREAQKQADDEFLDFLTFRFIVQLSYYRSWRYRWVADWRTEGEIKEITALLIARFDALYATSRSGYVRHAANILSYFRAGDSWPIKDGLTNNLVVAYLSARHHEAWQQSSEGIRELLESPNLMIQTLGVKILHSGGAHAAERVIENLPILRALLLSKVRKNTKKLVLQALEQAAKQKQIFAKTILPILEETMDFRSKEAIDKRLMVSFVRMRRQMRCVMSDAPDAARMI